MLKISRLLVYLSPYLNRENKIDEEMKNHRKYRRKLFKAEIWIKKP